MPCLCHPCTMPPLPGVFIQQDAIQATGTGTGASEAAARADAIADAQANLPIYPDDWAFIGFGFGTTSNVTGGGPPYTADAEVGRFKWRVVHTRCVTCYLKVWIKRRTTMEGMSPVETDEGTYTWTPASEADCQALFDGGGVAQDVISATQGEVFEPATDGLVELYVDRFSCVAGYDPGASGSDGFETPA